MKQIFVGLFTEGNTDIRFLEKIVENTINIVALECNNEMDIFLNTIKIEKSGKNFIEQVLNASRKGIEDFGMTILCVQADADNKKLSDTYKNKIVPALNVLSKKNESIYCKTIVAIVPIQETEAWMLADKELLKKEIGTNKTDNELGINKNPESFSNPKDAIEKAIRIARKDFTKRQRKQLTISELYQFIGQSIDLNKLNQLESYSDFRKNVRNAFIQLNLLQE